MIRHPHLLLAAIMAAASAMPAQAIEPADACQPAPPEPSGSPALRPNSTAVCSYDVKEMYRRLGQIISTPDEQISVEAATVVFGLPPMDSSYDSARQASYTTVMTGVGGWKLRLWLRESAYPLDGTPPAFTRGPRQPHRLVGIDQLDVRYDITITLPEGQDTPGTCMTAAEAAALALSSGRTDDTARSAMMVTHMGPGSPSYVSKDGQRFSVSLRRQAGRLPTEAEMKTNCVVSAVFMQPPKKDRKSG